MIKTIIEIISIITCISCNIYLYHEYKKLLNKNLELEVEKSELLQIIVRKNLEILRLRSNKNKFQKGINMKNINHKDTFNNAYADTMRNMLKKER